jgi:hypothetical protein
VCAAGAGTSLFKADAPGAAAAAARGMPLPHCLQNFAVGLFEKPHF